MGKETLLGKLGKLISSLILLGVSSSWFVFTIWGIATWSLDTASLVSNRITIILLYIPLFVGMFILFIIVMAIGFAAIKGKKKEEDKKDDFSWVPGTIKEKFSKTVVKEIGKSMEKEVDKDKGDFSWVTDEMKEKFFKFIEEAKGKKS